MLSKEFKYVFRTNVKGKNYTVYKTGASIADSPWNERGFVVRSIMATTSGVFFSNYQLIL